MNKQEKQVEVDFLAQCFTSAPMAILGEYQGLTVAQVTALRRDLTKTGSRARVVKNTLANLAVERVLKDANADQVGKFKDLLRGPSFLIFSSEDVVAPAKVVSKFCKSNDKFKVRGAWFEGKFVDTSGVEAISSMPGKAEILGMLLRLINAPATQVARLINEPGSQVVRLLDAQRKNIEARAAA